MSRLILGAWARSAPSQRNPELGSAKGRAGAGPGPGPGMAGGSLPEVNDKLAFRTSSGQISRAYTRAKEFPAPTLFLKLHVLRLITA